MCAARASRKGASLVLAAVPMDTDAGIGTVRLRSTRSWWRWDDARCEIVLRGGKGMSPVEHHIIIEHIELYEDMTSMGQVHGAVAHGKRSGSLSKRSSTTRPDSC
jgi:hypothetical protein